MSILAELSKQLDNTYFPRLSLRRALELGCVLISVADSRYHNLWRFSVTTLAFTAPGTLSHAVYIKYLKLGFLKVPKAVTTTQVVVTAGVVSEVSHNL
jgi:hypothetical protein